MQKHWDAGQRLLFIGVFASMVHLKHDGKVSGVRSFYIKSIALRYSVALQRGD
jgi:hypothetical protein